MTVIIFFPSTSFSLKKGLQSFLLLSSSDNEYNKVTNFFYLSKKKVTNFLPHKAVIG